MTQRATITESDHLYFITANVQDRQWFFVYPERAEKLGQAIQTCGRIKYFEVLAYCILPNHFHMLVRKLGVDEVFADDQAQRKLGSMRCEERKDYAAGSFLFPHRRLPSRRSQSQSFTVSDLMHSIKSTFSQSLRQGKFWQHRSYLRVVETQEYLNNVLEYIQHNYMKMNLPDWYGQPPFVLLDLEKIAKLDA